MLSLLDTAEGHVLDHYVVFRNLPVEAKQSWFWKLLKPGFEHVEIWRNDRGAWVRIDPCLEYMLVEAYADPPWMLLDKMLMPTIVRVQSIVPRGVVRDKFFFGPVTCVELTKAVLGIRSMFVRTPWQLYKFLRKKNQ